MKRLTIGTLAVAAICGLMAWTVYAQNAHCIRTSASGINSAGDLAVSFKLAGFGRSETVHVTASASVTAVYACRNRGQHCPNAANNSTISGIRTAEGDFSAARNGSVRGSLTVEHPGPGSFSCPPGQSRELACLTYGDITLTFTGENGASGSCTISAADSQIYFPGCTGLCD